ncbi:rhodanese-like domain-containing protein [Streptomyces sp. NBC_01102]|uniref:rhodanese-like domain-containing protein n=1 Tax=Streptomyces sp. NBC_01102 TaxID=2903749 RepID=UPI0038631332|nr:rhodanese-like domain-containing protein [Streptomyces sp. NBC_01102]
MSLVKRALPPSGDTEAVAARFAAQLAVHADVHDVAADLEAGVDGLVIIDTRPYENWRQGHLPGAVPMRATSVATDAAGRVPVSAVVVTYGWGPACDSGTRAAEQFALLGYSVKEMLGGYEYWVRRGLPVQTRTGMVRSRPDPLTGSVSAPSAEGEAG